MEVNFIKASPAQNTTVLITSFCPREHYLRVAERALAYECLHAEQVGFLVAPTRRNSILRLEMAGGEFCGNATLSAAAYVRYKGLSAKESFKVDASGADKAITCSVKVIDAHSYYASCTMPPAKRCQELHIPLGSDTLRGHLIEFDGIAHFVFESQNNFTAYEETLTVLKKLTTTNAIGIIAYQAIKDKEYQIKPFVHVKATGTSIFERGCGSGSLALGVYLLENDAVTDEIMVHQPGGIIKVKAGKEFVISTEVLFTCAGRILA